MKDFKIRSFFVNLGLICFFLFPYVLFFKFINFEFKLNIDELVWALKNSFVQAGIASIISTGVGFYLSLGILKFNEKMQNNLLKVILLPQILPSLFSILIAFSIFKPFPMGHFGVILIFSLINIGFATFQFANAIRGKLGQLSLVSEILGIKKYKFYSKILLPLLKKDIAVIAAFIFVFCLSSLSIPLVAGGGKGTNLELLIYEKIFIDQQWSTAWLLLLIQTVLIVFISFKFLKNKSFPTNPFINHSYLQSKFSAFLVLIYLSLFLGGYLSSLLFALPSFQFVFQYRYEVLQSTLHSITTLVLTSIGFFIVLLAWIDDYIRNLKLNVSSQFISISVVLVGFSFYLSFPQNEFFDLIKSFLAFTILFSASLFKLFFEKKLSEMKMQIQAAQILGVSHSKIIFKIIFPQLKKQMILSFSLLSIWVLSDFAIMKSMGNQTENLGMMVQNFLSSYRLEAAYLLSFYILVVWFVLTYIFSIFIEGFYVDN